MKDVEDELGEKIMKKFIGLRAKTYSYIIDDKKKSVIKRKFKFENYKNCLKAAPLDNKIKYLEKKLN